MHIPSSTEVFYVIGSLEIGGSERHLSMVARSLARSGWAVSVYSLAGHGPLSAELTDGGVALLVPPVKPSGKTVSFFARWGRVASVTAHLFLVLLRRRPAIVHFFLPHAYLAGAPAALLARRPICIMSRRSLNVYQTRHPFLAMLERSLHRAMAAVVGNSRSVVRELKDQEGVSPRRLALIYNGIDCERFGRAADRAHPGACAVEESGLTLVVVANLIEYKGHLDLIEALGRAGPRMPLGWRLLIVGRDDGLGRRIKARIAEVGIAANVTLLGVRSDVPELMQACDIGLLCSHQEGFSNAILEAMAAGLPMIVTDVGGNGEAVVDGETGLVVPPHDPESLAAAILRLAHDAGMRTTMSIAARARVRAHFSLEQCVAGYEQLYRTLLAGGAPADVAQIRAVEPDARVAG